MSAVIKFAHWSEKYDILCTNLQYYLKDYLNQLRQEMRLYFFNVLYLVSFSLRETNEYITCFYRSRNIVRTLENYK